MKMLRAALIVGLGIMLAGCSTPVPKVELTAEQVLEKSAKVYLGCRTYRDSGVVSTTYITGDKRRIDKRTFTTAFQRPDAFRFEFKDKENGSYIIWRKGQEVKTWWDLQPVIQQGKSFSMAIAGVTGVSGGTAHTVPNLLLPQDVGGVNVLALKDVKKLDDVVIGGKSFYRVQVVDKQVLWIGKDDFLIHRIESIHDFKSLKTERVTDYEPVVNGEIAPALLDFNLPASAAGKATIKAVHISRENALNNARIYRLMENGRSLSPEQAAQLEKQLTGTEKDIPLLTELLGYYKKNHDDMALRKKYSKMLLEMVKNYPRAEVLGLVGGAFIFDSLESEAAKQLWLQHLEKNPKDAKLRRLAADNMLFVDTAFSEMCLKQGKELEPDDSRWDLQLAFVGKILADEAAVMTGVVDMINTFGQVSLKCRMVEKNGDGDAVGTEISREEVRAVLKQPAVVKCVKEHKRGDAVLEEGVVVTFTPKIENGVFSLQGGMQIKRLDAGGAASVVVASKEFMSPLKKVSGRIALPPLRYNGKIWVCYIQIAGDDKDHRM